MKNLPLRSIQIEVASLIDDVQRGKNLMDLLASTESQSALLSELTYGSIRHLGQLKAILNLLIPRPLENRIANALLLVCIYQLWKTRIKDFIIVDESVEAMRMIGCEHLCNLTNAVLRNFIRCRTKPGDKLRNVAKKIEQIESDEFLNYQLWWIQTLKRSYPKDFKRIIEIGNLHPTLTLRINRRKISVNDYLKLLKDQHIKVRYIDNNSMVLAQPCRIKTLPGFFDGLCSIQDLNAQRLLKFLKLSKLRDNQRVLDACAAPGGKSCLILENYDVNLTALDVKNIRLKKIHENLHRLGLKARVMSSNATKYYDDRGYNLIIADVPCSASGIVRKQPDVKWNRKSTDINKFIDSQYSILENLWKSLKNGGHLIYITCSIFPHENRKQIEYFCAKRNNALLVSDEQYLPDELADGFYYALIRKTTRI